MNPVGLGREWRLRKVGRLYAGAAVVMLATAHGWGADLISLPYLNDFESADGYAIGALSSDPEWRFDQGLEVATITGAISGEQAVEFYGAGWLSIDVDPTGPITGYPVTWLDFYLKPAFSPEADLPDFENTSGVSAGLGFVKVDAHGELHAFDGKTREWTDSGVSVATDGDRAVSWMRLTYRLDYASKLWDLYVNGALTLPDIGFVDTSLARFEGLSLRGAETATGLDAVYMGADSPLFADSSGDGLPDAWLIAHGLSTAYNQRYGDPDRDGIPNILEYKLGLNPTDFDSDHDGVWDLRELLRGTSPVQAESYELGALPFVDGFEEDTPGLFVSGTRLWRLAQTENAVVEVKADGSAAEGGHYLSFSNGAVRLERDFANTNQAVIWLDFRLKAQPRVGAPSDLPADVAASFYFSADGSLMALDGNSNSGGTWVSLCQVGADNAFRRVVLRMDYGAQTWSIWLDGVRKGSGLGFANPVPFFSGIAMENASVSSAALDAVVIGGAEPSSLDNDGDGLTNAEEIALGTNPDSPDTDGDHISDPVELQIGLNPTEAEAFIAQLANEGDGVFAWRTSFASAEGYASGDLNGQLGWLSSGATVTAAENGYVISGSGADGLIDRYFGSGGLDQVWVTFRAKLHAGPMPAVSSLSGKTASMFGFSSSNVLTIYDSAQGKWVSRTVDATAGDWNSYALYLDYRSQKWMLMLNGRLIARDLPFRDGGLSTITRFRMLQIGSASGDDSQEAFVDDLVVTNAEPAGFDFDDDDLSNAEERALGLDPFNPDTDGDGMPDGWEVAYGLNPKVSDALADADGDGFSNLVEFQHAANPTQADTALAGYAHWDEWQDMTGNTVATLTADTRFPGSPSLRGLLTSLELPAGRGTNHGTRLRAWLKPTVTADYTFWIAADDAAELWLSTDDTPFGRRRIAFTTSYTGSRQWDKYPANQGSQPVTLTAGARYYVEVLHKQGTGSDNLAVAWQFAGGNREVIAAANLEAFPRFANDQDEDGLPDDWERAHGLVVGSGTVASGAYGDFDLDGISNYDEYAAGLSPNAGDSDGDLLPDALETLAGTSPTDAGSVGGSLSPWTVATVGTSSQLAGVMRDAAGNIWMQANEGGPSSNGDVFRYVYQSVTGDFELITSVNEINASTGSFGLIIRDGFGVKTPTAYLELLNNGSYRSYVRRQANASLGRLGKINSLGIPASVDGYWIRMRRQGDVVSFYYSADGNLWTYFTGVKQSFPTTCLVGFATWNGVATPTIREVTNVRLRLDADGDGLYDEEETLLGTAIDNPDTDGDGLSDYEEVIDIGTDALGADTAPTEVAAYTGASGVVVKGSWDVDGSVLKSETPLGTVEYAVTLPADGVYRLQLDVVARRNTTTYLYFPFEFSVDGQFVQRVEPSIAVGETKSLHVTLPWLGAGEHAVQVYFDNTLTNRSITLAALHLQSIGGVDADGNGRADWIDARLAGANRLFESQHSFVSPLCVEGVSRFRSMMALAVGDQPYPVQGAPGMGWFSNVELSAANPTTIRASFENGALQTEASVVWTPFNLLVDVPAQPAGKLVIRKNDSVRFAAVPADEINLGGTSSVQIAKSGTTLITQTVGADESDAVQYQFSSPGTYTVTASYASGSYAQAESLTVEVVDAQFNGSPIVGLNYPYTWQNAKISAELAIETDTALILDQATALSAGGQQFRVVDQELMPQFVIARTAEDGPIIAQAEVSALRVSTDSETGTELDEVLADGTKIITTPLIISQLPAGLRVEVEIFVSGVTFDDGTIKKTFYAQDFDEIGRVPLTFIYPAGLSTSYCHRTKVYVGSVYLGTL